MTLLHFVVPDGIDDPRRPSGGNVYDRRVAAGLTALGWCVHEHRVESRDDLAAALGTLPDRSLVLVDGLVASDALAPEAGRLRLVVLLHMPMEVASEVTVVATSRWTRQWLLDGAALPADRIHVVEPGTDRADLARGTASGGQLLCVGAVTVGKGYDVLLEALSTVPDLPWHLDCVGALDLEPGYVDGLRKLAQVHGIADRLHFTGPLTGAELDAAYADADLLVSGSRAESYGMVVTEALAHGLPVIASDVGGVAAALGHPGAGVLVPPDDPAALAAALRDWLIDAGHRDRLRRAARERRSTLTDWRETSQRLADVLAEVS